jgi:ComF family protein
LFSLVFPDECRVCQRPLAEVSRIPVCSDCLRDPAPFEAEFFCARCRTPFLNDRPLDENGLCDICRRGLAGFDAAYAYAEYDGRVRKLIHLLKYEGIKTLAEPLGRYLSLALPRGERFDVMVPMPLHWLRRLQRGFNQSELLAAALSRRTGIPVVAAMKRVRKTDPQAGLTSAQRRQNVSGAFSVTGRKAIQGKSVLIVDDVLTTGATVGACAGALRRAGARRVSVLTVARVDRRAAAVSYSSLSASTAAASAGSANS